VAEAAAAAAAAAVAGTKNLSVCVHKCYLNAL
jgi:hypothetical protein